jgi:hypothetical protein
MNGGKKWRCEPVKHSSLYVISFSYFTRVSFFTQPNVRWHDAFQNDTDDEPSDNPSAADGDDDDGDGDLQESLGVIEEMVLQESYGVNETGLGHAGTGTSDTRMLFGHAPGMHLPRLDVPALFGVGATRSAIMEEAFRRAQEASYTAGYWTAVYQMHASQRVCFFFCPFLHGSLF